MENGIDSIKIDSFLIFTNNKAILCLINSLNFKNKKN